MHVAVDDVPRDHELEIRHPQHRRVVGVRVADLDGLQRVALEREGVALRQRLRERYTLRL